MSFSQEIRFKIGADASGLYGTLNKVTGAAQAAGAKMDEFTKRNMTAAKELFTFRRNATYAEENSAGKIKMLTKEMFTIAKDRAKYEQGTAEHSKATLAIDTRIVKVRQLQAKIAKDFATTQKQTARDQAGATKGDGEEKSGAAGPVGNLAEGLVKRMIWLGAGAAISGIINSIKGYVAGRVAVAGAQETSTAEGLASTRSRIGSMGGMAEQLKQGRAAVADMEGTRELEEKLVKSLSTGPQGLLTAISSESMGMLVEAEKRVLALNSAVQKQHDTNALIARDLEKQISLSNTLYDTGPGKQSVGGSSIGPDGVRNIGPIVVGLGGGAIRDTEKAMRAGKLNSVKAAQIELRRLQSAAQIMKKSGTLDEQRHANVAVRAQQVEVARAQMGMMALAAQTRQGLTEEASGGRVFRNGARRPRSEIERLAERAAMFRNRARNQILTGSTGNGPGTSINAARADESSVAERLGRASSSVGAPPGATDLSALKAEIANSNLILKSIDDALRPQGVK